MSTRAWSLNFEALSHDVIVPVEVDSTTLELCRIVEVPDSRMSARGRTSRSFARTEMAPGCPKGHSGVNDALSATDAHMDFTVVSNHSAQLRDPSQRECTPLGRSALSRRSPSHRGCAMRRSKASLWSYWLEYPAGSVILKSIPMDAQGVLGEHGFPFFCSDNA